MLIGYCRATIALILVAGVAIGSEAPPEDKITPAETLVEQLSSEDLRERAAVYGAVVRQHRGLIEGVMGILGDEKMGPFELHAPRTLAAQLVGRFGSADFGLRKSIPILVSNVEYKAPMAVIDDSYLTGYPCAVALREIGHTSVHYILEHLLGTGPEVVSDRAIELYARTIEEVYGFDRLDEAVAWVRIRANKAPRSRNLARLLAELGRVPQKEERGSRPQSAGAPRPW